MNLPPTVGQKIKNLWVMSQLDEYEKLLRCEFTELERNSSNLDKIHCNSNEIYW